MKIGVQGFKLPRKQQSDELPSFEVYELGKNATQLKIFTRKLWLPRCRPGNSSPAPTPTQTLHNFWCCERAACYAPSILSPASKGRPEWGQGKGQKLLLSETIVWGRYLYCSKSLKKHWHANQNQLKNWWSTGMMKIQNIIRALMAQHCISLPLPPTPKSMINLKDNTEGRKEVQQWCRCLQLCVYVHIHITVVIKQRQQGKFSDAKNKNKILKMNTKQATILWGKRNVNFPRPVL